MRGKNLAQKSLTGMLREIPFMLLKQFPILFEQICPIYRRLAKSPGKKEVEWDLQLLKKALLCLPSIRPDPRGTRRRFLLFIDALDENADAAENAELLAIITRLADCFHQKGEPGKKDILKIVVRVAIGQS
jgi:hypothetical protein